MKEKIKFTFFKSLRFRIMVILVVIGIVPSFIVKNVVVNSYETRAVSIRAVNLKNQCDILGNQLMKENYLREPDSDVINGELSMLSAIYNGRILLLIRMQKLLKIPMILMSENTHFQKKSFNVLKGRVRQIMMIKMLI